MKVVIQKVKRSSVIVDNKLVNKIDKGLCILVGFTYGDSIEDIKYMVNKVINLRVFDDENHVMNKSILENLDLTLYSKKLQNGLEIFVVPNENVNNIYCKELIKMEDYKKYPKII